MSRFDNLNHEGRNAVIYARVSSVAQTRRGGGLGSQQTRCREYAAFKGYNVVKVFEDDLSGSTARRPGMEALLSFLKKHRNNPHIVLIDDISRLARDVKAHIELRAAITMAGGILESPTLEFGDDADSELQEYILATVSQHQRKKNAEQTLNRMHSRVLAGYWVFQTPVGYRYQRSSGQGKILVRDEPVASIIKEGLEGFASGRFQSQAEVMRFFQSFPEFPKDRSGIVRNQRVKDILTRPVYAGMVEAPSWGIPLREGKHTGLISFETFETIQERLNGTAKVPARKDLNADFPLRGIVVCAECDKPLTGGWAKGKCKSYPYYSCFNRHCTEYRKSIPRHQIETAFEEFLKSLQAAPNLSGVAYAMFKDAWNFRSKSAELVKHNLKKDIGKIEKQIEQILDRIVESSSSTVISAYEERITKLERQKLVSQEKLQNAGGSLYPFEQMFQHSMAFLSNPWKLWASGKLELRRLVLKLTFADKLPYHRKEGLPTPALSLPFNMLRRIAGEDFKMARPSGQSANRSGNAHAYNFQFFSRQIGLSSTRPHIIIAVFLIQIKYKLSSFVLV
ncbi:MAG: recombinase family protein [Rhodospirillales bacterium]|nr:recombinase family protein [Rhodospirillales bacterium]